MKGLHPPLAACAAGVLASIAAVLPLPVSALDAGPLRLSGQAGAADRAEIVVAGTPPFDAASFQARVATANSYAVAGLTFDPTLAAVQIRTARGAEGRTVLHVEQLPAGRDHYDLLILYGDRDRLELAEYRVDLRDGRREFAAAPAGTSRTPTRAPSPAVVPVADAEFAVRAAVQAWARAWSERDVERYAAAYTPDYSPNYSPNYTPNDPPNDNPRGSHAAWLAERRARILGRSRIEVEVKGLQIEWRGDDVAVVRFQQSYRSDRLTERGAKTLTLARSGTRWLITAEAAAR